MTDDRRLLFTTAFPIHSLASYDWQYTSAL